MTKTELLAELAVKFHIVLAPDLQATYPIPGGGTVKYYTVSTFDLVGNVLRDRNIPFYVEDEGGPAETAHWSGSEPKPTPEENAQALLIAYLNSKIGDGTGGTVRSYRILEGTLNIAMKQVVVSGLQQDWTWKDYLVTHDGVNFQITPFS